MLIEFQLCCGTTKIEFNSIIIIFSEHHFISLIVVYCLNLLYYGRTAQAALTIVVRMYDNDGHVLKCTNKGYVTKNCF
jgi:hypothetical protein